MEPRSRRCGRAETFEKVRCGRRTAFNPIIHQYIFMAVILGPSFGRRTSRECFRPGCTGVAPRPKYRGSWCKSHPCGKLRPKHRGRSFAQERFRMTALQSVDSTTGRWDQSLRFLIAIWSQPMQELPTHSREHRCIAVSGVSCRLRIETLLLASRHKTPRTAAPQTAFLGRPVWR